VRRLDEGDRFSGEELKRMERHGAICHGEFLIRVFQGKLPRSATSVLMPRRFRSRRLRQVASD